MFRYGEVAALLRTLKKENVGLEELAALIESASGVGRLALGPPVREMKAPIDRLFAAWQNRDAEAFLANWSANGIQMSKTRRIGFAEISAQRRLLFGALDAAAVHAYEPIYLGYHDGVATFFNAFHLEYRELNGTLHRGAGCELYKLRNESGRWVIIENQEGVSC
jgi:hypothetical protein